MRARIEKGWDDVRTSLWFLPAVLVGIAILFSSVMIEVDVAIIMRHSAIVPWLFSGTADAARTVLSTIAGSLITVISVAFSITIVALQQASVQFTPRVLRTFTADRGNQLVLGIYTATFVYALLVLRAVRSASDSQGRVEFVPGLSVTIAIVLAVLCLGLLIYFIHHISQTLQVSVIIGHVHDEAVQQIDAVYPDRVTSAYHDTAAPSPPPQMAQFFTLRSHEAGFIWGIDEDALVCASISRGTTLWVHARIGVYVTEGGVLAEFYGEEEPDEGVRERVRDAFLFGKTRSNTRDPSFGVRQLVDIALKALSPGINDPTTAEYALNALGDLLGRLAGRVFPSPMRDLPVDRSRIVFDRLTWDDYVVAAFGQIRYAAGSDIHVTLHLVHVLHDLALHIPPGSRSNAVAHQLAAVREASEGQQWSADDHTVVRASLDAATHAVTGSMVASERP